MEGNLVGVTKTCEGYTWRLTGNVTEKNTSCTWNIAINLNLNFIKNLSTPWHGAVDQDWRSKMCVQKHASQAPDGSTVDFQSLSSQSSKGAP